MVQEFNTRLSPFAFRFSPWIFAYFFLCPEDDFPSFRDNPLDSLLL